ncbi:MAG: TIM barrel protein [Spirochaetaceae bacterium]|nr:MAG: TIM barrel protein [Spirochaetaceae bacterium]
MEPVICFEMLFPNLEPQDKVARIAAAGFRAVEFWGWRDKNVAALRAACSRHGVGVANFSGHRRGDLIAPDTWALFFTDLGDAIETARFLGCSTLMLLSNELGEGGKVLNTYPDLTAAQKRRNLARGLEEALERIPEGLQLVLEPLNTRIDHAGYYLEDMETAVSLIREIKDPRLKILCDLYHLGVMGQDLEAVIGGHIDQIGYFHIADFPGRHEPGTGNADWRLLLRQIIRSGYNGPVGFEYSPEKDSAESLHKIQALWEELFV